MRACSASPISARTWWCPARSADSLAKRGVGNIRLLWQHDPAEPIGRWLVHRGGSARTCACAASSTSRSSGRATSTPSCATAAVDGLSIGFRVERARAERPTGLRRLEKLDLWEISIVTFPMLPGARVETVKQAPTHARRHDPPDRLALVLPEPSLVAPALFDMPAASGGRGRARSSSSANRETIMKIFAFVALLALAAAGCTTTQERVGGAAVGAGVGAIAGPVGAVAGAGVGAVDRAHRLADRQARHPLKRCRHTARKPNPPSGGFFYASNRLSIMIPVVETKSTSHDVASAFEDFARAFEAFKDTNDTRLGEIETRLTSDVVTDEKLARIDARARRRQEAARPLRARSLAPAARHRRGDAPRDPAQAEHKAAFDAYMRSGEATGLQAARGKGALGRLRPATAAIWCPKPSSARCCSGSPPCRRSAPSHRCG